MYYNNYYYIILSKQTRRLYSTYCITENKYKLCFNIKRSIFIEMFAHVRAFNDHFLFRSPFDIVSVIMGCKFLVNIVIVLEVSFISRQYLRNVGT